LYSLNNYSAGAVWCNGINIYLLHLFRFYTLTSMCVRALPFGQGRRHGSKTEEARGGRGAVGAEVERRRRENRGAEGAERVGCGEGAVPPPQKKYLLWGLKFGEFLYILGGISYRSAAC